MFSAPSHVCHRTPPLSSALPPRPVLSSSIMSRHQDLAIIMTPSCYCSDSSKCLWLNFNYQIVITWLIQRHNTQVIIERIIQIKWAHSYPLFYPKQHEISSRLQTVSSPLFIHCPQITHLSPLNGKQSLIYLRVSSIPYLINLFSNPHPYQYIEQHSIRSTPWWGS